MKIYQFIDEDGHTCLGTGIDDDAGAGTAGLSAREVIQTPDFGYHETGSIRRVKAFLPPVLPTAIFCIGLNYGGHAEETGMEIPRYPVVFMKNPAAATGHRTPVIIPESCRQTPEVDYEAELAVVIGRKARNVHVDEALEYVAGYTAANDISARRWQKKAGGGQWVRGKSFDTFCPLGPALITPDEIEDPNGVDIACRVNGEVLQKSNTGDMIFSVARLIAFLSEDTTLLPGTVILTGTPEGVGFTRNPPIFLKPGDTIETTIERIGTLYNPVR